MNSRRFEISLFFIYAVLFGYLLFTSWLRWPDAAVDFGYVLYNLWIMSKGAVIGVDFNYYYGPLAPLLYSSLFKIFGPSVILIYLINGFLLLVDIVLLHMIFRRFSLVTAAFAVTTFLCIFSMSQFIFQGNYNLIAPYKLEAVLGLVLLLAQVWLTLLICEAKVGIYALVGLGLLSAALLFTSTEMAIASIAVTLMTLASGVINFRHVRHYCVGITAGIVLMIGCLFYIGVVDQIWRVAFRVFQILSMKNVHLKELMGMDRPVYRSAILISVAGIFSAVAVMYFLIGEWWAKKSNKIVASVFILLPVLLIWISGEVAYYFIWMPKILPLFPAAGLFIWFRQRKKNLLLGVWSALSLAMLLRMALNCMLHYYGFTLALGATLCIYPLFFIVIPRVFIERGYSGIGFKLFGMALGLSLIVSALVIRQPFFAKRTFEVSAGIDPVFDWNLEYSQRGLATKELIEYLRPKLEENEKVLGLPDGHIVNYLLRHARPGKNNLSMGELSEFGEEKILAGYRAESPRYIFISERERYDDENGFGEVYGKQILEWVNRDYELERKFGEPMKISLYRRKYP